jgi:hypothetical protein
MACGMLGRAATRKALSVLDEDLDRLEQCFEQGAGQGARRRPLRGLGMGYSQNSKLILRASKKGKGTA